MRIIAGIFSGMKGIPPFGALFLLDLNYQDGKHAIERE